MVENDVTHLNYVGSKLVIGSVGCVQIIDGDVEKKFKTEDEVLASCIFSGGILFSTAGGAVLNALNETKL